MVVSLNFHFKQQTHWLSAGCFISLNILAACCIVASEAFVRSHKLENQAIEIVTQCLETDPAATFESRSAMELVGYSMTKNAADKVFTQAGFAPGKGRDWVGGVELHDCFAANEVSSDLEARWKLCGLTDAWDG